MKYAYLTIITNKHFGKIEKTLQTNIAVDGLYDTKLFGSNTVYHSLTQIIHHNIGLKCFFFIYLNLY